MRLSTLQRVTRKFAEPNRGEMTYDERWNGDDGGLIVCWENGRKYRQKKPELASKTMNGELPSLVWKGGISDNINLSRDTKNSGDLNAKYGTLYYLAKLQGLSGKDLDIIPFREIPLMCTRTGWLIIFTGDSKKYGKPLSANNALEICHRSGRELGKSNPELASRAKRGELPALDWPGGVDTVPHPSRQFGSLFYLAQWQGLRDESWHGLTGSDKNMSTACPVGIKCAASGTVTVFTKDARKYLNRQEIPDIETYPTPTKPGIPKTYGKRG